MFHLSNKENLCSFPYGTLYILPLKHVPNDLLAAMIRAVSWQPFLKCVKFKSVKSKRHFGARRNSLPAVIKRNACQSVTRTSSWNTVELV
jgi:hypothetical protein